MFDRQKGLMIGLLVAFSFGISNFSPEALADGTSDLEAGYALWLDDQSEKAIEKITTAIESNELNEAQLAIAFYLKGYSLWELDRDEEAVDDLTLAIEYNTLDRDLLGEAYNIRGSSRWSLDQDDLAIEDFTQSIGILENPASPLYRRAMLSYINENYEVAFPDMIRLANEFPEWADEVKIGYIWDFVAWAQEAKENELLFALLFALKENGYKGPEEQYRTTGLMQELALLYLDRNEVNKALVLIYDINDTDIILETLIDNRYQPLWDKFVYKSHASLDEILKMEIQENKEAMEEMPDKTSFVGWYADSLRKAGRPKDAIKVYKEALDNIDSFTLEEDDDVLWLLNGLAYSYQDVGNLKKSFKVFDEISETKLEDNPSAISQHINHSISLLEAGRFEEALKRLETLSMEYSSDFGDMFISMGKACALHETGQTGAASKIGDQMLADWKNNSSAAQLALLCLERYEDSVTLFINRLNDEAERASLLVAIQKYQQGPYQLPYKAELFRRYEKVKNDPRVLVEIEKYGRVLELPLYATYWGDF